jgi:hypothetical protein
MVLVPQLRNTRCGWHRPGVRHLPILLARSCPYHLSDKHLDRYPSAEYTCLTGRWMSYGDTATGAVTTVNARGLARFVSAIRDARSMRVRSGCERVPSDGSGKARLAFISGVDGSRRRRRKPAVALVRSHTPLWPCASPSGRPAANGRGHGPHPALYATRLIGSKLNRGMTAAQPAPEWRPTRSSDSPRCDSLPGGIPMLSRRRRRAGHGT